MKLTKFVLVGIGMVSFGLSMQTNVTDASAYTTYRSIPRAIRGYYISPSANDSLKITQHRVAEAWPLADMNTYSVTKVNYTRHKYHVHCYIDLGGKIYFTLRLNHYAKNKIKSGSGYFYKVSKASYHYFLTH